MRICALDLSLTATGYALAVDGAIGEHGALRSPKDSRSEPRLIWMRDSVMDMVESSDFDFVLMEEIAFSQNKQYAKENAALAWMVRTELFSGGIPWFTATANQLKKFCCGTGGSSKNPVPKERVMKDLLARFGHNVDDNNQADGIVLAYIGMAAVGDWQPTIEAQREVVEKVLSSNPGLRRLTTANLK